MSEAIAALLTPEAVRERAHAMLALARAGRFDGFTLHEHALHGVADTVAAEVRANYPDLRVPYHARWRHFSAGGRDRWGAVPRLADAAAQARAAFDVAIVSVLLDAGAGMAWRYREPDGSVLARSEGLAVASLAMLAAGRFADDGTSLRADAATLGAMTEAVLADGFQVTPDNKLVGLQGRVGLLRRLGDVVAAAPQVFARADTPRPGGLFDLLAAEPCVAARDILVAVLRHLGPIWPGRESLHGINLGDCWRHPGLRRHDETNGLVPFHKLSQWLGYSLIEPLEEFGIRVTGIDALTGLPEYRNGGLFLDSGVLRLRDGDAAGRAHDVGAPLIVEWRALTVALLDELAPLVRARLAVSADDFPLARVLEGGTWSTGRRVARSLREDGGPPLRVVSDGTVF